MSLEQALPAGTIQIANPGPEKNARSYRVGNPSGLPNLDMPKGRGDTENDNAATEKQNQ